MQCHEHPKYTGQRKPRTDCKTCLAIYEDRKKLTTETKKPSKAAPKEAEEKKPKAKTKKLEPKPIPIETHEEVLETKIDGPMPDRLLSSSANEYRKGMIKVLQQFFPDRVVSATPGAHTITLRDRERYLLGANLFRVNEDSFDPVSVARKNQILAQCEKKPKKLNRGELYYSDTLETPIIIISYNKKTSTVYFREWHSNELLSLDEKEFKKLELRDVVGEDDFKDDLVGDLTTKVLTYW